MHVYFSGIGGAGLGPLALLARDCGYEVSGSDQSESSFTQKLVDVGIEIYVGEQDGSQIERVHSKSKIDWLVYTAALPNDHPELNYARKQNIRITKRDEFINHVISDKKLQLIAVSGTHGKTTTSAMLVWLFKQLDIPLSYQVGTNLPWGPSAQYDPNTQYFVYEADEYDRNMLHFHPHASIIVSLDYDHPDTYPTRDNYNAAFRDFAEQSTETYTWDSIAKSAALPDANTFPDDTDVSSIEPTW